MKTKIYIWAFLLFFSLSLMAQNNHYYYYKGQKKYLTLDKSSADINVKNTLNKSSLRNSYKLRDFTLENDNSLNKPSTYKYAKITFQNKLTDVEYFEKLKLIKSRSDVRTVSPNFKESNGKKIGMSDYLYVKLKKIGDYQTLVSIASQKKVSIIEQNRFMPLWYTLRCTEKTIENTLEVANSFFETGLFASAIPDLLVDDLILCANDTNFGDLWGLNNSSNPNIDINACNAWTITEGNGVNVAVLDQGIELTHNDLQSNISQNSYDTESNSSPSQIFGNHGTHVAGTVAAIKDNNLQVVGIAPQSTLISISNSLAATPNSRIRRADGINWAWQNGAHIINNSWGSAVQYDVIDDAIENALNNGRNGLGTIVVFASGNNFGGVGYPANSNSNILAVGSITSAGNRSNFSNFGNELDVVAPGSAILLTINNNGTDTFDGTSMVAPHVAGIAALILSVNPNLTVQEVNAIIESTAQKVGGYSYSSKSNRPNGTWNNKMGYGLVDAYAAVQMALSSLVDGPSTICRGQQATYSYSGSFPKGSTISWSPYVTSGQGTTQVTIGAFTGNSSMAIKANVTINGITTTYQKIAKVQTSANLINPTIKIADDNPTYLTCCGRTNTFTHAVSNIKTQNIEWDFNVYYKNPRDFYGFGKKGFLGQITAKKNTYAPLIVSARARQISNSKCGLPSKWSNSITRYYGTVSSNRYARSFSTNVSEFNTKTPINIKFQQKDSKLIIKILDIYEWLDLSYSNKDLTNKEAKKIRRILKNVESFKNVTVKIFDLTGNKVLQRKLPKGFHNINLNRFRNGIYLIKFSYGNLKGTKKIIKN